MLACRTSVLAALLTAAVIPGCLEGPLAEPTGPGDEEPTGGDTLGTPCQDEGDCPAGLFCVGTPCGPDEGAESEVPDPSCGQFTCQLLCASEGHLLCSDAFSCCHGELECNSRNRCVEPK